jgi:hypothetical protein
MAALLALSLGTVDLPHVSALHHDADLDIVVVIHDGEAHQIGAKAPGEADRQDHCLACHFGRALRTGSETGSLVSPVVDVRIARLRDESLVLGREPLALPPLRSPPVLPVL